MQKVDAFKAEYLQGGTGGLSRIHGAILGDLF